MAMVVWNVAIILWQEEARAEIEDLAAEHEREREELLDSIRNQNRELQLWEQVRQSTLSNDKPLNFRQFVCVFLIPWSIIGPVESTEGHLNIKRHP